MSAGLAPPRLSQHARPVLRPSMPLPRPSRPWCPRPPQARLWTRRAACTRCCMMMTATLGATWSGLRVGLRGGAAGGGAGGAACTRPRQRFRCRRSRRGTHAACRMPGASHTQLLPSNLANLAPPCEPPVYDPPQKLINRWAWARASGRWPASHAVHAVCALTTSLPPPPCRRRHNEIHVPYSQKQKQAAA